MTLIVEPHHAASHSPLKAAADEVQISLVKTAHNPLIYEVHDFGSR
jgi:hypothetical protein